MVVVEGSSRRVLPVVCDRERVRTVAVDLHPFLCDEVASLPCDCDRDRVCCWVI